MTSPAIADINLATKDGLPIERFRGHVEDLVADRLARIPHLIDAFVAGEISLM